MRKEEQRLWDTMKRNAPPEIWMERVENLVGDGMPDIWFAARGRHGWVELKAPTRPKRDTTRLLGNQGLRTSQLNWHRKAAVRDLPAWTLSRDSSGELYLVHCKHSQEINELTATELAAASVADNWPDIFRTLIGEPE